MNNNRKKKEQEEQKPLLEEGTAAVDVEEKPKTVRFRCGVDM